MKLIIFLCLFVAVAFAKTAEERKPEVIKPFSMCHKYSCRYNGRCYNSGSIVSTLYHCCTYMKCLKGNIYPIIVGKLKKCGCCRDPYRRPPYGMIQNGGYGATRRGRRYFCCDGKLVLTYSFFKNIMSPSGISGK